MNIAMHVPDPTEWGPIGSLGWSLWEWEAQYDDTDANSHKYYRVTVAWNEAALDGRILYEWGRVGTAGQARLEMNIDKNRTARIGARKVDQKLAKGYLLTAQGPLNPKQITTQTYDRLGINATAHAVTDNQRRDAINRGEMPAVTIVDVAKAVEKAMALATAGTPVDMVDAAITAAEMKSGIQTLQQKLDELQAKAQFAEIAMHAQEVTSQK